MSGNRGVQRLAVGRPAAYIPYHHLRVQSKRRCRTTVELSDSMRKPQLYLDVTMKASACMPELVLWVASQDVRGLAVCEALSTAGAKVQPLTILLRRARHRLIYVVRPTRAACSAARTQVHARATACCRRVGTSRASHFQFCFTNHQ
jgi:hypothetical protein